MNTAIIAGLFASATAKVGASLPVLPWIIADQITRFLRSIGWG